MSTRSQLRFIQRSETADEQSKTDRIAQIYRHSDGYPDSVLRDLVQLKDAARRDTNRARACVRRCPVPVPRHASTMTLYVDEGRDRSIHADHPSDPRAGQYGAPRPADVPARTRRREPSRRHSRRRGVSLRRRAADPEPVRRAVRVDRQGEWSPAFPRWDGPTEEAFERASWQFHGPLEQALEEIVAEPG